MSDLIWKVTYSAFSKLEEEEEHCLFSMWLKYISASKWLSDDMMD